MVADPRNPRPVLLACVPQEQHSLPLYVLRAALAERGVDTLMLGAALPANALASAVRRCAPAGVVLWSQLPRYAAADVFARVPRTRQQVRLFACGPGWSAVDLPDRVRRVDELRPAVDQISRHVVGAGGD